MGKRLFSFLFSIIFIISAGNVPVGAVDMYVPGSIDDTDDYDFFTGSSRLISEYWEDDYFYELTYSDENGACLVDDEWYIPVNTFCKDAGIKYSRNGKKFTISSDEFTWECKINQKTSKLDGEDYVFENKPLKRNGRYVINADELNENSCYEIEKDEDGIVVTSPYQLKRLIVETKNGKKFSPKSYGAIDYVISGNTYILQFNSEKDTKEAFEKLSAKKKIASAEPDRLISMIEPDNVQQAFSTSIYSEGYGSDWNVEMLGSDDLAQRIREAGINRTVTVAIVDTGIDYTHNYLRNNVPSKGYDFVNSDYDAYDDNGHGTHVAGIVLNTFSGSNLNLLPVKVLSGQGYGSTLSVANGIIYAAESGADVINLSLGGASSGSGHYEDTAISKAISLGCTVVVAAGNESGNTAYYCPAHNYDAIVVAAIDSSYNRAYFSNYGNSVDVAAPGVDIRSSVPGGGYEYWSGTSMATPHVSGLAALIKLIRPYASNSEIESILCSCAQDLGSYGFDVYYGYGVPYVAELDLNEGYEPTQTPTPTDIPILTDIPTPTPTDIPILTDIPTPTPKITNPVRPTATPIVTKFPTLPPFPELTSYPTTTPGITSSPTNSPTLPVYNGSTNCNISSSSSSINGKSTLSIKISTGSGIKNVTVTLSDGNQYDYTNSGNGIEKNLNFSGTNLKASIYAYDYYGNIVYSGTIG